MLLIIDLAELANESRIGDSIAVNGVCLTISRLEGSYASFELSAETLSKSTLGNLQPSSEVNVERAMKPNDRFGGHFILGHIDGTATIKSINIRKDFADMKFTAKSELLGQMVVKGSVAVDGISLTIANINKTSFSVAVIPETLKRTTLGKAKTGDNVNIEIDIIVKTVQKQFESTIVDLQKKQPLTVEKLKQLGF
jgi:riboflavin synthase